MIWPRPDAWGDDVRKYYIAYTAADLRNLAAFLEKHTGTKLDIDKLSQMVDAAGKTRRLWHQCDELRKAIPCPMPSTDMWACMVAPFWLPHEKESLEFMQTLYDELKYRVDNKIGAIANEKYRLLFGELPPWHTLEMFNYLASLGAISVIESYTYHPGPPPPIPEGVTDPFERLAWWDYYRAPRVYARVKEESGEWYSQGYVEWARDYKVDGAFLHSLVSCRHTTLHLTHARNVLLKYAMIPSMRLQSDIVDIGAFSEAEFKRDADALIEAMDHYKRIRQEKGMPVAHPI